MVTIYSLGQNYKATYKWPDIFLCIDYLLPNEVSEITV